MLEGGIQDRLLLFTITKISRYRSRKLIICTRMSWRADDTTRRTGFATAIRADDW